MKRDYTLKDVRAELAGEIEFMMNSYLNEIEISVCEYEQYYPDSFTDDFIDDDMFLKCIGLSIGKITIKEILENYCYYLKVQNDRNILECMDFDWDSYCKYHHTTVVRDFKLSP